MKVLVALLMLIGLLATLYVVSRLVLAWIRLFRSGKVSYALWIAAGVCAAIGFTLFDMNLLSAIVLLILAWKPLHRRFQGWAILCAYLLSAIAAAIVITAPERPNDWLAFSINAVAAILVLLTNRQKPIEERKPSVAWMVIHGLWNSLEKEGLPAGEIERLKRLTPEDRARLMASIRTPQKTKGKKNQRSIFDDDNDDLLTHPAYSDFSCNVWHDSH